MRNPVFFIFLVAVLFLTDAAAQNEITLSAWEMHRGIGDPLIDFPTAHYGDQTAYAKMNIPAANDSGWEIAPLGDRNQVLFTESSRMDGCLKQVDFTYFQSQVFIPANTNLSEFTVGYGRADDGARIYFFNSKNPSGAFNPAADLMLNRSKPTGVNLKDEVALGEINRVVIVQFDNCAKSNTMRNINIAVNGSSIIPQPAPACEDHEMLGHWTFEGGNPLADKLGNFGDLVLKDSAMIIDGQLSVIGNGWARSDTYTGVPIKEKTLVAWARIDDNTPRGGSILSIDKKSKDEFDAIVYGEWNEGQWIAGSNFHQRSKKPGSSERYSPSKELVKMAISYQEVEGKTEVKIYRDGVLLDEYLQGPLPTFDQDVEILFGTRHTLGNNTRSFVSASIEEARIYGGALCQEDIEKLKINHEELPEQFVVRAFSVNEGKGGQGDYWFALRNGDMAGRILNDAQISGGGKRMEITTVDLGEGKYAFKITNMDQDNTYLVARDDKKVYVEQASGSSIPEGAIFKSVQPLTSAPGAEEYNYRSFESAKHPQHYLRHRGYVIYVDQNSNTELFRQDASWLIRKP